MLIKLLRIGGTGSSWPSRNYCQKDKPNPLAKELWYPYNQEIRESGGHWACCWCQGHIPLPVHLGAECHYLLCWLRNTPSGPKSRNQEAGSKTGSGAWSACYICTNKTNLSPFHSGLNLDLAQAHLQRSQEIFYLSSFCSSQKAWWIEVEVNIELTHLFPMQWFTRWKVGKASVSLLCWTYFSMLVERIECVFVNITTHSSYCDPLTNFSEP